MTRFLLTQTGRAFAGRSLAAAALLALTACAATSGAGSDAATIQVSNCGQDVDLPAPAERLFVNDSNLISMILAFGAEDQVAAVTSIGDDRKVLEEHYGDAVDALPQDSGDYPSLETVIAQRPDVMVAGWSYGFDETKNLTPDSLAEHDIGAYALTESCRQSDGAGRGIVDPWTALREDLTNLGRITGHTDRADAVIADIDSRLKRLEKAPAAEDEPVLFLFDSGEKAVFTSGAFGAPQAILDAAGARNAVEDLKDTWTEVSWERLAAAEPDAFVFVDYPGQTYAQKVAVLKAHPATRDLDAVKRKRFLNLPYAMWTSGPLNIDAAEEVRGALEEWKLVPTS